MHSSSTPARVERAKPLFGTVTRVRAFACDEAQAQRAVTAAFAAMQEVHRLMSFHDEASDVSRLNRQASAGPVPVDPHTLALLELACEIAAASDGAFDPTIAPYAVAAGDLPRPADAPEPAPGVSWRDIGIDAERGTVRFRRPLWIDLGGIAKGYGVDLGCAALLACGIEQGAIDAGGDLRIFGPAAERVALDAGGAYDGATPILEIQDGAVASSGHLDPVQADVACHAHFDGRSPGRALPRSFAGVIAERCAVADALTKVVLACGAEAAALLERYRAFSCFHAPGLGWQSFGSRL